jgi:hypothetical protein
MNPLDRDNYIFFTTAPQSEFEAWMDQASVDEINYAITLIAKGKAELQQLHDAIMDEVTDTTQAENILKQFTLSK